jgi:DNA-binding transcriptional MocR family regulator
VATEVIAGVLAGGGYRKHMEELRRRLARARREAAARLEPLGFQPWLMPRGGFYLWCRLPQGRDSADIARRAMEQSVVLAPGNAFSVSQSAAAFLRFNVAQMQDPRVATVLREALSA